MERVQKLKNISPRKGFVFGSDQFGARITYARRSRTLSLQIWHSPSLSVEELLMDWDEFEALLRKKSE